MRKIKIITSICIFSTLLGITSIIKTQTRILEKKIHKYEQKLAIVEKDLYETQLDYFYLSSPSYLSKKIIDLTFIEYLPMEFSRIYPSYLDFNNAQKNISTLKKINEKKIQKR